MVFCGWELGSPSCLFGLDLAWCLVPKLLCCCVGAWFPKLLFLVGFGAVLGS